MEDEKILDLYWTRDQAALTQTEEKYGNYCFYIADNILQSTQDSEECVNDTWLAAWNAIPPQRPGILRLFLAKITRNLAFNRWESRTAQKRGGGEVALVLEELSECLSNGPAVEEVVEAQELEQCIRRFVRSLPEREGNLFTRRYFFTEPVAVIARRYALTENNVLVILSRTRKKLKALLIKEEYICEK